MSWLSCLCGLWAPSDPEHEPLLADSPSPITSPPRALPRPLNTLAAALFGRGPDPEPQSPLTPLRHSMRHTDDAEFPVSSASGPERERAALEAAEEQRRKEMLGRQQGLASAYCSRMCKVTLPPPTYGSISAQDIRSSPSDSRSRRSTLSRVHFDAGAASASTDTAATIMPSVIPPTPPHSAALAASVGGFPSPASFATARRRRLSAGSALSHVHVPPIRTQAQIGRGVAHMLFNFGSDSEDEFEDNSSSIVARRVALPPPSPYPFPMNASSDYLADAEVDHNPAPVTTSPSHSPAQSVAHSPTASTLPTPGLGTRSPSLSTDVIPEVSEAPGFPGFSGFSTATLPVTPVTPLSVAEELGPDPSPVPGPGPDLDRKGKGKSKRAPPRAASSSTHSRRPASSSPTISTHERGRPRRRTRRPRDASTSTRETADGVVYKHIGLGSLTPTARKRRGRPIVPREY